MPWLPLILLPTSAHHFCSSLALSSHSRLPAGPFFHGPPMCDFGGNVVNFACAMGCKDAVRALLTDRRTKRLVDLNSPTLRCRRSGLLPVHVAIASGNTAMYEFLVTLPGIPGRERRVANPTIKTRPRDRHAHNLTALQLAFWRGDAGMVQAVIEQRSRFQWRWGPLSSIMFNLAEIDSSGAGGNDLMELVIMNDAPFASREMLLDSFMDGMLHKLFRTKWTRFACAQHWTLRLLDLIFLILLLCHSLDLKDDPTTADRSRLPLSLLLLCLLIASFEFVTIIEWIRGRRYSHASWSAIGERLLKWMGDLHLYRRLAAVGFTSAGCVATLLTLPHPHPPDGTGDELAWGCLALGIYFHFSFFIHVLSVSGRAFDGGGHLMGLLPVLYPNLLPTNLYTHRTHPLPILPSTPSHPTVPLPCSPALLLTLPITCPHRL